MANVGDLLDALKNMDRDKKLVFNGHPIPFEEVLDVSEGEDNVYIDYDDYEGDDE
jgi:hypothetical protein